MKRYASLLKKVPWLYAALGAAAVMGGAYFFFFRGAEAPAPTVVLAYKDFLQQVSVSGTVVAARDVDLGFSQSGRVKGVYVSVGQTVSQGDMLAEVENADLRAGVVQQQAALEREQAKLASLQAGTRPEQIAVSQATVDAARAGLVDAVQDAYRASDAAVHNSVDQMFDNSRAAPSLRPTISDTTLKYTVEGERTAAESMLAAWGVQSAALSVSSNLAAAAVQAQNNLASIATFLSDANAALNRAISTTQVPQTSIDSYVAAVSAARTSINVSIAAVNAASAALSSAQKNLALAQAGATPEDIAGQQAAVKAAQAAVGNAQALLQKTLITAPFAGVITVVGAKTGALASANTPEISMISAGTFQIESYVPEVNIALLHVGDPATVTLDAYGESVPFDAKVLSIDPASTVRDGVSTYRVIFQFSSADPRIRAGMTANLTVTTLDKPDTLSVPLGAIVARGGKQFVTTKVGERAVEREVVTGAVSSLGEIEILSGLSAGDVVVLLTTQ